MTERNASELGEAFWERRWDIARRESRGALRQANKTMTDTAGQLTPGAALDAGCGDGVDATWLASRGWDVTAVDFVATALERGRDHADRLGPEVAARIDWVRADLSTWTPPAAAFDLVSAHYLHGVAQRFELFRRLASAVSPGGTLLIVGHHPSNLDISGGAMQEAVFFTTADVLAVLDENWTLVTVEDDVPRRDVTDGAGRAVTLRSAVVRARRKSRRN